MTEIILSMVLTTHVGMSEHYNNIHPTISFKRENVVMGAMKNSLGRLSIFAGHSSNNEFGEVNVGVASGYYYDLVPFVVFKKPLSSKVNLVFNPAIEMVDNRRKGIGMVLGIEITN